MRCRATVDKVDAARTDSKACGHYRLFSRLKPRCRESICVARCDAVVRIVAQREFQLVPLIFATH